MHIPIHPESLSRWKANVHGHTHANRVLQPPELNPDGMSPDRRNVCVSVEQTDYRPPHMDEVLARIGPRA